MVAVSICEKRHRNECRTIIVHVSESVGGASTGHECKHADVSSVSASAAVVLSERRPSRAQSERESAGSETLMNTLKAISKTSSGRRTRHDSTRPISRSSNAAVCTQESHRSPFEGLPSYEWSGAEPWPRCNAEPTTARPLPTLQQANEIGVRTYGFSTTRARGSGGIWSIERVRTRPMP